MGDESKLAKPGDEKQATVAGVEMANDEGGPPGDVDQSDASDAKGRPNT